MHPFAYYMKGQLERIGYQMEAIGEKPAAITMEFKGIAYMLHDRFAVVYLREAPADSELIRGVFDYHKMPVLFVVDHAALAGDLLAFVKDNKSPPAVDTRLTRHLLRAGVCLAWPR